MLTYTIETINQETYYELEAKVNEWVRKVFINSSWWDVQRWIAIRHLLETYSVEAVGLYRLESAAFDIFYRYKWPKKLFYWCFAMCHRSRLMANILDNGNTSDEDIAIIESMVQSEIKPYPFLTEQELKKFESWDKVYMNYNRLLEIFDWIQIIN